MNTRTDITNELKSLNSPLADMSNRMPYIVPQGYFDGLPGYTQESINATSANDIIHSWGKTIPFAIPDGYFENLPIAINTAILANEQELQLSKEQGFEVPQGYFEHLPQQILQAAKSADQATITQPTRTIPLGKTIWNGFRWAAAAVLVMGIGFSAYNLFWDNNAYNPKKALAQLPQSTINEYVQQHIDEFDVDMIENTVAANTGTAALNADVITDDDIILYLKETGLDRTIIN